MTAPAPRSRRPRCRSAAAPSLVAAALTIGCSAFPRGEPPVGASAEPPAGAEASALADDFPRSRQVAEELVGAMLAQPSLAPDATTLHATRPGSRFGDILVATLQGAGYDLRLRADGSPVTLDYDVRAEPAGADGEIARYTFSVIADGVRLERRYAADVGGIRGVSGMRVDGREISSTLAEVPFVPEVASSAVARRPAASLADEPGADGVAVAIAPSGATSLRRNLHETGRSNYADLLERYATVRQDVMVFANDSLVMGRDNKRLARRIVERFDPARDVISVIGCSHGPTALENGNAALANGRSYRVKEAFMLAGIDAALVLEEGCWAGTHFAPMPARGVLVTHKRRITG